MQGGSGADTFVFETSGAAATITDFQAGSDLIDLSALADLAGSVRVWLNGDGFALIGCFGVPDFDRLTLDFAETGGGVLMTATLSGHLAPVPQVTTAMLQGLALADLSLQDFLF